VRPLHSIKLNTLTEYEGWYELNREDEGYRYACFLRKLPNGNYMRICCLPRTPSGLPWLNWSRWIPRADRTLCIDCTIGLANGL
jgi:hypothetical protein